MMNTEQSNFEMLTYEVASMRWRKLHALIDLYRQGREDVMYLASEFDEESEAVATAEHFGDPTQPRINPIISKVSTVLWRFTDYTVPIRNDIYDVEAYESHCAMLKHHIEEFISEKEYWNDRFLNPELYVEEPVTENIHVSARRS